MEVDKTKVGGERDEAVLYFGTWHNHFCRTLPPSLCSPSDNVATHFEQDDGFSAHDPQYSHSLCFLGPQSQVSFTWMLFAGK